MKPSSVSVVNVDSIVDAVLPRLPVLLGHLWVCGLLASVFQFITEHVNFGQMDAHVIFQNRINDVHALQKMYGMEPRQDSKLTLAYARGESEPEYATAEAVAHELVMVDRIYKTTLYSAIIEDVMRGIANRLKNEIKYLTWTESWNIVRFYAPTILKLYCLRKAAFVCDCGPLHK